MTVIDTSRFISKYTLSKSSEAILDRAARSASDHIGTEHLLYGLLFDPEVKRVLSQLGKAKENEEDQGLDVDHLLMLTVMYLPEDSNNPEKVEGNLTPTTERAFKIAETF